MIAVLDDEESVRKAVVRLLEAAGHAAGAYASGEEFLRSWHFNRPDCLILDLQMPNLSGAEVQKALNEAGAKFPVIVMTAHDSPDMSEACMRAGAVGYLCKPADQSLLLTALNAALRLLR